MSNGKEVLLMPTNHGLVRCSPPEFKPAEYKGLRKNCGRAPSEAAKKAMAKGHFTGSALRSQQKAK